MFDDWRDFLYVTGQVALVVGASCLLGLACTALLALLLGLWR